MALHVERFGHGSPLVMVHGFTQNRNCWGPFAASFADHEVVLVDAPGHGRSGHADADLFEAGRLVGEAGGPAAYLGYSMGARMCLHLALERPDLVDRLVLIGSTAGIDDDEEREQRRDADERLAERLETEPLTTFIDDWLSLPLFAGIPRAANHREERLANDPLRLAASLRRAGTGTQDPLSARLAELGMPVLLLAGTNDAKFAAIAERMATAIGANATLALVDGAGHAVHLERPDETATVINAWLVVTRP